MHTASWWFLGGSRENKTGTLACPFYLRFSAAISFFLILLACLAVQLLMLLFLGHSAV